MLVQQCLEGNINAFECIIDRYQKAIYNVALRIVNNSDDAEDIAQNVFIKVYQKLATFDSRHKFFSWLYRAAINESLNFLNHKKRFIGLTDEMLSADKTPEEGYEENEMSQHVEIALMQLAPEQRALIVLKHFQDLAYQEIGQIMEIPEKTVKSRLYSARQLLKDVLLKKGFATNG